MQISSVNSIKPIVRELYSPKWGTPAFDGKNGKIWKIKQETRKQQSNRHTPYAVTLVESVGWVERFNAHSYQQQ